LPQPPPLNLPCSPQFPAPRSPRPDPDPLQPPPSPLQDDMRCAEDYVRFCCRWVLDHCQDDLAFIGKMYDPTALARLEQVGGWVGGVSLAGWGGV